MSDMRGELNRREGSPAFSSAKRERPAAEGGRVQKKEAKERTEPRGHSVIARNVHRRGEVPVQASQAKQESGAAPIESLTPQLSEIEAATLGLKIFIEQHSLDPQIEGKSLIGMIDDDLDRARTLAKLSENNQLTPEALSDAREEMGVIRENLESYREQLGRGLKDTPLRGTKEGKPRKRDEKKRESKERMFDEYDDEKRAEHRKFLGEELLRAKEIFLSEIEKWTPESSKSVKSEIDRDRFGSLRMFNSDQKESFLKELDSVNVEIKAAFEARKAALSEKKKKRKREKVEPVTQAPVSLDAPDLSAGANVINLAERRKLRQTPTAWEKLDALEQQNIRRTLFRMKDAFINKVRGRLAAENIRAERALQIMLQEAYEVAFPIFIEKAVPVALSPEEKASIIEELSREIIVGE